MGAIIPLPSSKPEDDSDLSNQSATMPTKPRLHWPNSSEEGDDCLFMACTGLNGLDHEDRGRKAFHHATHGFTRSGSSDLGPASFVPVDALGSRKGHRDKLGAHKGNHHGKRFCC
ncbi:hypothetical protein V6N13_111168 [Hibiscus sabdariffa]|uniref:Uncharacterized protein n=1 Tax=Hibiscus sabdariffa TaxID=183260 RepID=A0ABR2TJC9_9ROSI